MDHNSNRQASDPVSGAIGLTVAAAMLLGLPAAGIIVTGGDVTPYLQFPPVTRHITHAPFSWSIFGLYTAIDLALVLFIATLLMTPRRTRLRTDHASPGRRFPLWGWIGWAVLVLGWTLAWTRLDWFAPFQGHTFCLPWIGYILVVNALAVKRSGTSLLTATGPRFAVLVMGSAVFWWFFEYLNRFVENWYYVGMEPMGPLAYTLFASLAFATVLPAVLSTQFLLLTLAPLGQGLQTIPITCPLAPRALGGSVLAVAGLGLACMGIWPDLLFSLVWFAPLLLITGLQALSGQPTLFAPLSKGDWRSLVTAAAAALICGFFWELWNIGSLARWQYAIPYVDRFHLFAMPILGYGGYLPFGLECMLIGGIILGTKNPMSYAGTTFP